MKCTIHKAKELVASKTRYGTRWSCPVQGCTVVAWGGSTSTPADYRTRQRRILAHDKFDEIWKSGLRSRSHAYKALSGFMGMEAGDTHIGMFNIEQCDRVIEFAEHVVEAR